MDQHDPARNAERSHDVSVKLASDLLWAFNDESWHQEIQRIYHDSQINGSSQSRREVVVERP